MSVFLPSVLSPAVLSAYFLLHWHPLALTPVSSTSQCYHHSRAMRRPRHSLSPFFMSLFFCRLRPMPMPIIFTSRNLSSRTHTSKNFIRPEECCFVLCFSCCNLSLQSLLMVKNSSLPCPQRVAMLSRTIFPRLFAVTLLFLNASLNTYSYIIWNYPY